MGERCREFGALPSSLEADAHRAFELSDIIGADRDKSAIGNLELTMELNEPFILPPLSAEETIKTLNAATMVVIMIETAEALAEIDEIARVEGVDLLLIGTNDLCSSFGIPGQFEHGKVRDAYAKAVQTCRKYGKHLGVGGLSAYPSLADFVKMGARYVSTDTDLSFLLGAATAKAKQAHEFDRGKREHASMPDLGKDGIRFSCKGMLTASIFIFGLTGPSMAQERILISSEWGNVTADLADNDAATSLVEQLPVTIEMRDHLRQEKTGTLPSPLPEVARQTPFTKGTLGLWSSDHFVIYYRDGRVPQPGIIILGQVIGDVSVFDRPGPVTVRIERAP